MSDIELMYHGSLLLFLLLRHVNGTVVCGPESNGAMRLVKGLEIVTRLNRLAAPTTTIAETGHTHSIQKIAT